MKQTALQCFYHKLQQKPTSYGKIAVQQNKQGKLNSSIIAVIW